MRCFRGVWLRGGLEALLLISVRLSFPITSVHIMSRLLERNFARGPF